VRCTAACREPSVGPAQVDGEHVHDGMLGFVAFAAGPDRTALITDVIAVAEMGNGRYEWGCQDVVVGGG
jgi:N-acetylglucosamine-6-phosphate deacetylase